jgi:regulator of protease activity HflC (stomatin/prohibitin superfamily)
MLDRLIDFLIQFIALFKFWIVLHPYEAGVQLRLGKFYKILQCGFHWILPFKIDYVVVEHIIPCTHSLGDESITTADGKSVGFHAVVTYRVHNVKKAILEIEDVDHAVRDACSGEIGRVLRESTWEDIQFPSILTELTTACRSRGFRYGIEILSVQLAGLALCRSLRIMQK